MANIQYQLLTDIDEPTNIKSRLTVKQYNKLKELSDKGKTITQISKQLKKPVELVTNYLLDDSISTKKIAKDIRELDRKFENKEITLSDIKETKFLTNALKKSLIKELIRNQEQSDIAYFAYVNLIKSDLIDNSGSDMNTIKNLIWKDIYLIYDVRLELYSKIKQIIKNGISIYSIFVKVQKSYKRKPTTRAKVNGKYVNKKQHGTVHIEVSINNMEVYDMTNIPALVLDKVNDWMMDLDIIHLINHGNGFYLSDVKLDDEWYIKNTIETITQSTGSAITVIRVDNGKENIHRKNMYFNIKPQLIHEVNMLFT